MWLKPLPANHTLQVKRSLNCSFYNQVIEATLKAVSTSTYEDHTHLIVIAQRGQGLEKGNWKDLALTGKEDHDNMGAPQQHLTKSIIFPCHLPFWEWAGIKPPPWTYHHLALQSPCSAAPQLWVWRSYHRQTDSTWRHQAGYRHSAVRSLGNPRV